MGQHTILTNKEFKDGLDKLCECFPNAPTLTKGTILRYWEYLGGSFTDGEFKETIEEIIRTERFFPAISVFYDRKPTSLFKKAF